ncbi:MAG: TIGR02556 family CRISPR-associated protein [Candidatus Thermoplasmatota archaeon]
MLRALYELGQYMEANEDISKFESLLDLDKLSNCQKIIAIKFNINDEVKYIGTHVEDYDRSKGRKILYMRGSPRGGDFSPSSKITRLYSTISEKEKAEDGRDTLQRIWGYGWFKKYGGSSELTKNIMEEYRDKEKKIREEVSKIYEGLDTDEKDKTILTIKIVKGGKEHFVDDFEVFKKKLENVAIENWKNKYGSNSAGKGKCILCQEEKEVAGFAFPFPFYNLDKKGFAPYFNLSKSHQRIPICEDCSFYLQLGKNFLENNTFPFRIPFENRLNYYVIPEFILGYHSEKDYSNILSRIEKSKIEEGVDFPLISVEDYITSVVMEEKPSTINLHFLFYTKPQQSQQRIEEFVSDVPPSYLKEINEKIKNLEEGFIFDYDNLEKIDLENYKSIRIKNRKNMKDRGYLESLIFKISPNRKEVSDLSYTGLEYATKILRKDKISYDRLINLFLKETRRRFRQKNYERHYAINSFLFLNFLYRLNLLGGNNVEKEEKFWKTEIKEIDDFFDEYSKAFDKPEKKASFLQGVVTSLFLGVQASKRGNTPFRKKLCGLRLDERKLQRLHSELKNKFIQYDRDLAYRNLRETASMYLIKAENSGWTVSNDIISYYFSLGLNLGNMFKPSKNKEGEKNE